jgi:hypothetical protein
MLKPNIDSPPPNVAFPPFITKLPALETRIPLELNVVFGAFPPNANNSPPFNIKLPPLTSIPLLLRVDSPPYA